MQLMEPFSDALELFFNEVLSTTICGVGYLRHTFGDYQNALEDYNQAIRFNPAYVEAYYNRATLRHSFAEYEGAIADYTRVIELNPNFSSAYYGRAGNRLMLGDHQGAIEDYDQALQLNPSYEWAYFGRGVAHCYLGNHQEAIQDFAYYAQIHPNSSSFYNLGIMQFFAELYSEAVTSLTKSLEYNSTDTAIYYVRSVAYEYLGNAQSAQQDFNDAVTLDTRGAGNFYPNDEHAYFFRGAARMQLGNREEARIDLQTARQMSERHHNVFLCQQIDDLLRDEN